MRGIINKKMKAKKKNKQTKKAKVFVFYGWTGTTMVRKSHQMQIIVFSRSWF